MATETVAGEAGGQDAVWAKRAPVRAPAKQLPLPLAGGGTVPSGHLRLAPSRDVERPLFKGNDQLLVLEAQRCVRH